MINICNTLIENSRNKYNIKNIAIYGMKNQQKNNKLFTGKCTIT